MTTTLPPTATATTARAGPKLARDSRSCCRSLTCSSRNGGPRSGLDRAALGAQYPHLVIRQPHRSRSERSTLALVSGIAPRPSRQWCTSRHRSSVTIPHRPSRIPGPRLCFGPRRYGRGGGSDGPAADWTGTADRNELAGSRTGGDVSVGRGYPRVPVGKPFPPG